MGNQHTQMPHELGINSEQKLKPVDKLVYVYMRSHADKDGFTYVSIDRLALECELNWRTVSDSVTRLLKAQEISIAIDKVAKGSRSKTYKIEKDDRHFEMISQKCLDHLRNSGYSINEKCVLICTHEYSYKTEKYGEIHETLEDMAQKINMPIRTFKRAMSDLKNKGVILNVHNHDNQLVRRVQWDKIMMEMIYQVQENTEDIKLLKAENKLKDEIISDLTNRVTVLEDFIKEQQLQSTEKDKENFTGYLM